VILVMLLGESRIAFAMSRDHLLTGWLGRTAYRITLVTGGVVAVAAVLTPIDQLAELVDIGSLLAFTFVSLAVVVLRRSRPTLRRAFRTPFVPWVPGLSALGCLYLMVNLPVLSWLRLVAWLALGLLVYAAYGARHSRLAVTAGPMPRRSAGCSLGVPSPEYRRRRVRVDRSRRPSGLPPDNVSPLTVPRERSASATGTDIVSSNE
jgi:APA family basic amino acid/polyamine antiporter